MEHIGSRETEPLKPSEDEGGIASAILCEGARRRVEFEAVDLDEEPPLDQHVDSSDAWNGDLLFNREPSVLQPLPGERFHA
ncbi:hypothetical protein G3T36_14035 [Diaminobutyricibacter tongyongensis]|uniref:Uncharacterized protein n=1 Tax=Leifsonia tongyongensis TaxID=1268043 RepID=A0A6L9Y015_9MICO|nr:hypothetical protein [Diaminobutyricibacter tongyongensis]NEN06980.1 hypothetical protein [Diaminobutyricibacter tongyongensis]